MLDKKQIWVDFFFFFKFTFKMGHKTVETACNISHTFGPTGSDQLGVELRRSSKALPKAKLFPEKMAMVTVWWSAAPLIPYRGDHGESTTSEKYAQQIDEMRQNCNSCSRQWSTAWAKNFSTTMLNSTLRSQHFQGWTHWAMTFSLILHIHLTSWQSATTSSSISTTFCRGNTSTTNRRQEMLSKSSQDPEAWIFTLQD